MILLEFHAFVVINTFKSYSCTLKDNPSNNLNVKLCLFNSKTKFYFLWGIIFSSSDLYHEKSLINQIGYWGYWVWIVSFTIVLYEHLIWPIKLFYMDLKCDENHALHVTWIFTLPYSRIAFIWDTLYSAVGKLLKRCLLYIRLCIYLHCVVYITKHH